MTVSIDAGKLRDRLEVLQLREEPENTWSWFSSRKAKGRVETTTMNNLFSKVGIGARGAEILIRRQSLTLHNAILWGTQHLFLTAIQPEGRLHLRVQAALVQVCTCTAVRTADAVGKAGRPVTEETMRVTFPGVLTERYIRFERENTHDESDVSYVLVTGKPIALQPGDLVTITDGQAPGVYHVTAGHKLDEWKNEYEIMQRGDI